jgi:hypothetical protein
MSMYRTVLIAFLAFAAFAPRATSQSTPSAAPQRLAADTPSATPGGATFTVPAGWAIVTGKDLVILEPPETDTHVIIFDSQATDASAAVADAWAAFKPEKTWPQKLVTPLPARKGWEERQVFDYETSPNERVIVQAIAMRANGAWTVLIMDGSEPTAEKRGAPISLIIQSLRPKGYSRESFAGRKAQIVR